MTREVLLIQNQNAVKISMVLIDELLSVLSNSTRSPVRTRSCWTPSPSTWRTCPALTPASWNSTPTSPTA